MNWKTISAAAAAATAICALAGPASAGGPQVVTDAGFTGKEPDGLYTRMYGDVDVEAGTLRCTRDRRVDLYRVALGPDVRIGRTRSDTYNFWSITIPPDKYSAGTYYVRALRSTLPNGTICLPDKSNELTF